MNFIMKIFKNSFNKPNNMKNKDKKDSTFNLNGLKFNYKGTMPNNFIK